MQYMHADLRGYLSIFENIRCNSVLKPLALSPLRRAHKWLKLRMFLKIYFRGYLSIFENIRRNSVLKPLALSPLRRAHKSGSARVFGYSVFRGVLNRVYGILQLKYGYSVYHFL